MSEYRFTGGQLHILYKPSLIGKEGENRLLDFDLTQPPALTEEQINTISKFVVQSNDVLKDTGVVMWVSYGYKKDAKE